MVVLVAMSTIRLACVVCVAGWWGFVFVAGGGGGAGWWWLLGELNLILSVTEAWLRPVVGWRAWCECKRIVQVGGPGLNTL